MYQIVIPSIKTMQLELTGSTSNSFQHNIEYVSDPFIHSVIASFGNICDKSKGRLIAESDMKHFTL